MKKYILCLLMVVFIFSFSGIYSPVKSAELSYEASAMAEYMVVLALEDHEFCSKGMDSETEDSSELKRMVKKVSEEILTIEDIDETGNDEWRKPSEILARGKGDCDDYTTYFVGRLMYTKLRIGLGIIVTENHVAPMITMNNGKVFVFEFSPGARGLYNLDDYLEYSAFDEGYEIISLFPILQSIIPKLK